MDGRAPFDIAGRSALVTGSSRGIGYALARGLALAGCVVALHGRDEQALAEARDRLAAETGADVRAHAFDLTDAQSVADGVRQVADDLGGVQILVNNAGVQRRHPLLDFPAADWDAVIATNLTASFLVAQHVARDMVRREQGGKIVNIGSVQSQLARPDITPYAASKGGVVMLTRGLCAELAAHDIQVNALAPGYIVTELTRALVEDEEFDAWVRRRTPAGRWGAVDDLVGALLFLVSPASAFVNGQVVYVDGGMTAVV